jgi:hypothetical protein
MLLLLGVDRADMQGIQLWRQCMHARNICCRLSLPV